MNSEDKRKDLISVIGEIEKIRLSDIHSSKEEFNKAWEKIVGEHGDMLLTEFANEALEKYEGNEERISYPVENLLWHISFLGEVDEGAFGKYLEFSPKDLFDIYNEKPYWLNLEDYETIGELIRKAHSEWDVSFMHRNTGRDAVMWFIVSVFARPEEVTAEGLMQKIYSLPVAEISDKTKETNLMLSMFPEADRNSTVGEIFALMKKETEQRADSDVWVGADKSGDLFYFMGLIVLNSEEKDVRILRDAPLEVFFNSLGKDFDGAYDECCSFRNSCRNYGSFPKDDTVGNILNMCVWTLENPTSYPQEERVKAIGDAERIIREILYKPFLMK